MHLVPFSISRQASVTQQLIKGCEQAIHQVAFISDENKRLRAESDHQKRKRALPKQRMPYNSGITASDGRERVEAELREVEADRLNRTAPPQAAKSANQRAPPRCTNCWVVGHKRTKCPNNTVNSGN